MRLLVDGMNVAKRSLARAWSHPSERYAPNTVLFESRSFERYFERPEFDRGHTYLPPNEFNRIQPLGAYDGPDCTRAIGPRNRYGDVPPNDALSVPPPAAPVLKQLGPLDGFPPATQERPDGPR